MSSLLYPLYAAPTAPHRLRGALADRVDSHRADARQLLAAAAARGGVRRNDVIHIIFIIAIIVLLVLAASLVAAAIILCAQHGGVLEFVVKLDPWTVKVGCKKI